MKEANIERVQTDLETLRGAMDLDLPFDEKDIWLTLGIAASLLLPILVNLEERPEGAEWFSFLPMATLGSNFGIPDDSSCFCFRSGDQCRNEKGEPILSYFCNHHCTIGLCPEKVGVRSGLARYVGGIGYWCVCWLALLPIAPLES